MLENDSKNDIKLIDPTERTLARGIHSWHVSLIALGGIIGSCYFLGSGYTVAEVGPSAAIAYAVGGLIIYSVMMCFGELLVNIPRRGSFISYSKEFMGSTVAAGVGWCYWCAWAVYIPSEALACGILMNLFVPWNAFGWSLVFMGLITLINVFNVTLFGHIESILSLIKIGAVAIFSITAIGIIVGIIGDKPVGLSILLNNGDTSIFDAIFPFGGFVVVTTMIMILVNYSGSEIVGLAAAETQNPEVNIPRACKTVTYRIILIYIIPIVLLVMILPYSEAGLKDSVFSTALEKYGISWAAIMFTIVTMVAAFSCANSGVFSTVRTIYGLSVEGLAPKSFQKLNRFNVPQFATILSMIPMWLVLAVGYFIPGSSLYAYLLSMSGFTGAICWLSIILSQLLMRRRLKLLGYDAKKTLKARTNTGLSIFGLVAISGSLIFMAWQPDLWPVLLIAVPTVVVPMLIYALGKKLGKTRTGKLHRDEVAFDDKFPKLTEDLEKK